MSDIIIRPTQPEDAEAILAYLRQVGGETNNLTFGGEGLPFTAEQERGYIRSMLENPRALMLSAWDGERLVGEASLSPQPRRMQHRAELGISVARSHWHTGLGSRLLENIIDFARECGTELINLEVRSDNAPAIRLYRKFGFRRIGTSPAYLKIDGEYADADLMVLDLREGKP